MDEAALIESVSKTKRILTVEEHTIHGGLGSAIAEVLSCRCPVKMDCIGMNDMFTETGPYPELLRAYGICPENIVDKAKRLLRQS